MGRPTGRCLFVCSFVCFSGSSASDLGVTVGPSSSPPILGSAVARCLWESHWREVRSFLFKPVASWRVGVIGLNKLVLCVSYVVGLEQK